MRNTPLQRSGTRTLQHFNTFPRNQPVIINLDACNFQSKLPASNAVWSTLIGRGSRGLALIGRELHSVAMPALLCHKEPARRIQSPILGAFCLLLAGSLWHKDSWLPCIERSYYRRPFCKAPSRGLWMRRALYSSRTMSKVRWRYLD